MKREQLHPVVQRLHDEACAHQRETYIDPHTGYTVLTRFAHEQRGTCCGNACRHCPYNWKNVRGVTMLLLMLCSAVTIWAQPQRMDSVVSLQPGSGQRVGQGPVFFPMNVLTGPEPRASRTSPVAEPREVCSLGLDGSILLGLRRAVIVDLPGPDFTVFENSFMFGSRTFAEPARVEVSRDGIAWYAFPFDSLTLRGCAGVSPTTGLDAFNPSVSGGDAFDLATIGVDSVRWIRITDVTRIILDNHSHPFYDPTLSGFDLDAVIAVHTVPMAFQQRIESLDATNDVTIDVVSSATLSIYDVRGAVIYQRVLSPGIHTVDLHVVPRGAVLVVVDDGRTRQTLKVKR